MSPLPAVRNTLLPDTLAIRMRTDHVGGKPRNRFCLFYLTLTATRTPPQNSCTRIRVITQPARCRTSSRLMCEERVAFLYFALLFVPLTPAFFSNLPFLLASQESRKLADQCQRFFSNSQHLRF